MRHALVLCLLCGLLPAVPASRARSPAKEVLHFGVATDATFGFSMYVVGNHPDLGDWAPTNAIRMRVENGTNWSAQVGVQAGTAVEYKFIRRDDSSARHCESTNVVWPGGANLVTNTPAQPDAPYPGKNISYLSAWSNISIIYSSAGGPFTSATLAVAGPGRGGSERLYRVDGIGEAGESIEFVFSGELGGTTRYDNAPFPGFGNPGAPNYHTSLDAFFVQDGDLFNYQPPSALSPSRIETVFVNSAYAPAIPSRNVRVYLPRGYDENPARRYPVLYMHDGQNVFNRSKPNGFPPVQWDADLTADREIGQGRMRETIIVGVDNTPEREREYIPPGDDAGSGPGTGDLYANFLIHNVRPAIDTAYRTLHDPPNTLCMGSSLGGLISAYLGIETNVFGKIGCLSPSFWAASNLVDRMDTADTSGLRIYMDWGKDEPDGSMWQPAWNAYALFLADGYAVNDDLRVEIGCAPGAAVHNETAWGLRLHHAFRFLLNIRDEPNLLAQQAYPPLVTGLTALVSGSFTSSFMSLRGFAYRLERAASPSDSTWSVAGQGTVESLPWADRALADTNPVPAGATRLYRVIAEPRP